MNAPAHRAFELRAVSGTGPDGETLRDLSVSFDAGRFHILRGPVGGGREVLLRLLGLLQPPESGEILVQGNPTHALSEAARSDLRAQRFGFVFTAPFLLQSFSVVENVAMPLFRVSQVTPDEARRRTEKLLGFVGLAELAEAIVEELSSLDQYRVAVARGLINEPSFLLVESLDGVLSGEDLHSFVELLHRIGAHFGTTIIATASPAMPLLWPHRVLDLANGAITGDVELLPEAGS